jgi:hypothetical protein
LKAELIPDFFTWGECFLSLEVTLEPLSLQYLIFSTHIDQEKIGLLGGDSRPNKIKIGERSIFLLDNLNNYENRSGEIFLKYYSPENSEIFSLFYGFYESYRERKDPKMGEGAYHFHIQRKGKKYPYMD